MDKSTVTLTVELATDLIRRIHSAQSILRLLKFMTGMELVAIAHVTTERWVACAVLDESGLGLVPGGELDVHRTICSEVKRQSKPVAVDDAEQHPRWREHVFFRTHPFRSYIAEPIVLASGECFGTLCAMGRHAARVSDEKTLALFRHFADQIAAELDSQLQITGMAQELLTEREGGALRETFIAVLGHDLRNPLSSVSSAAHVLKLKRTDVGIVDDMADRILTNVRRMASMVDDLLDVARGRLGGGMRVSAEPIQDLGPALEEVVDELRGAHPDRLIACRVDIVHAVHGDRARLQQLVSNLVGNAVTHGAVDRPIEVLATTSPEELEIRVRNQGSPIPAESIPGLFDAFSALRVPVGRGAGLGLGLYICEQIAMAHGGDLSVVSTPEGETEFVARLPTDGRATQSD